MNRRDVLAGCAALALPPFSAAGGAAAAAVAWSDRWLAVLRAGEPARLHALPGPLAAGPALAADAAWTVCTGVGLQRWPLHGDPDAQPAAAPGARRLDPAPHALAAAADGRVVAVAQSDALVLLDGRGGATAAPLKVYAGTDAGRRRHTRAAAIHALPARRSLLVAWPGLGEWWEVALDPAAPPLYEGLVHDHRLGEGLATPGYLGVRRAPLGDALPALDAVDGTQPWAAGRSGDDVAVVHLDVRREIARWRLPGAHPRGACLCDDGRGARWWLPQGAAIVEVDPKRWSIVARHDGPGAVVSLHAVPAAAGGPGAGQRLWALFDDGPGRRLAMRRDGGWALAADAPPAPVACAVDGARGLLRVAATDPPSVTALDGAGRAVDGWALPADAPVRGVATVPQSL